MDLFVLLQLICTVGKETEEKKQGSEKPAEKNKKDSVDVSDSTSNDSGPKDLFWDPN